MNCAVRPGDGADEDQRRLAARVARGADGGRRCGKSGRGAGRRSLEDQDYRRDLCGEPQLRQSLWPVSRRRRHRQREAERLSATRPRRLRAALSARVEFQGRGGSELSADAEQAVPDRRAARRQKGLGCAAEPDPRLLPQHRTDQRRQERHVRGHVDRRRLYDGLFRRLADEDVEVGEGIHARR